MWIIVLTVLIIYIVYAAWALTGGNYYDEGY